MKLNTNYTDRFVERHIGIGKEQEKEMLTAVNVSSLEELIDQTIPKTIRLARLSWDLSASRYST